VPIGALRAELTTILTQSKYWDGRVNVLQVTDAKEQTLQIRALASAANASLAWDLRCDVREKLIDFIQRQHPESLPRVRLPEPPRAAGGGVADSSPADGGRLDDLVPARSITPSRM
jgi:hypothetical protein